MKEYKIDDEFVTLFPEPAEDELKNLEESLKAHGYMESNPIVVWKEEGIIVDGHHRYDLCRKLGIEAKIIEMSFKNREEVIAWMIHTQIGRRNLSKAARIQLAERLRPVYEMAAKERQGTRTDLFDPNNPQTFGAESPEHDTNASIADGFQTQREKPKKNKHDTEVDTLLATAAGVSRETYRKGKKVLNSDDEELKEEILSDKKTISAAYNELTGAEKSENLPKKRIHRFTTEGKRLQERDNTEDGASMAEGVKKMKELFLQLEEVVEEERRFLSGRQYIEHGADVTFMIEPLVRDYLNGFLMLCDLVKLMEPDNEKRKNVIIVTKLP